LPSKVHPALLGFFYASQSRIVGVGVGKQRTIEVTYPIDL